MSTKNGLGYTGSAPRQNEETFVEARKVDPREILSPQAPKAKKFDPSRLVPVEQPRFEGPSVEEVKVATAENIASRLKVTRAEEKKAPPPRTGILARSMTDDLVNQLAEELGLLSPLSQLFEVEVPIGEGVMKVTYRLPEADDNLWAVGVMDAISSADERYTLVRTESQWKEYTSHLLTCACILKIQDKWIWERLDFTDKIHEVLPDWDGVSWRKIPATIRSIMAQSLYGVLGRLHSDTLFLVSEALDKSRHLPKRDKPNPTEAI